jgi:hypothetical protein
MGVSLRRRWSLGMLGWGLWALALLGLAAAAWLDHLLRQAGRADLVQLTTADLAPFVLAVVSAITVGAVLASRRSRHPVGWLLLALGLTVTASFLGDGYSRYGLLARPGALPGARYATVYTEATLAAMLTCVGFVLLLTPSGSLPSPRWRWWARLAATAPVVFLLGVTLTPKPLDPQYQSVDNPLAVHALGDAPMTANQAALGVSVAAVLVAAGSLVIRFRRASGTERQQLRWVALAAAMAALAALTVPVALGTRSLVVFEWAVGLCATVLPLAIGAAILRYRLYDLDRIISRTLAYGLLTVLLGGVYAGVVLGLGQLLGRDRSLLVAVATLALAAAFQPARRRVQELVDRRFNRRRYDAARTIESFAARLRQQVDLDALTAELLAVVNQTMQPVQASLWLRPSGDPVPPGSSESHQLSRSTGQASAVGSSIGAG